MSATVRLSVPSRKYATLAASRRLAWAMDIKGRGGQAGVFSVFRTPGAKGKRPARHAIAGANLAVRWWSRKLRVFWISSASVLCG
jgi:hypothetical protein